jgi:hypothetical protein
VVAGSITVDTVVLNTGDGAGLREVDAAAMSVTEPTEILLLDLGDLEQKRTSKRVGPPGSTAKVPRDGGNGSFRLEVGPA